MSSPIKKIMWLCVFFSGVFAFELNAQDAEGVYSTSLVPLKNAVYKFVFTTENDIPPDAEINIVFPPQINLSRVVHAGSKTFTGGFDVSVIQDTLIAKRTGRKNSVAPNNLCDFKVASIINPSDMARQYGFKILIKENNSIFEEKEMLYQIAVLSRE